jgi:hypothetical protein
MLSNNLAFKRGVASKTTMAGGCRQVGAVSTNAVSTGMK